MHSIASWKNNINAKGFTHESTEEINAKEARYKLFQECPIYPDELISNLGMFLNSKELARILFLDNLYKQILDIPGVIMEFGTLWGAGVSLFSALRGVYEPYNCRRKIIGFDTFEGFPSVHAKDGNASLIGVGNLALPQEYETYLDKVLELQEQTQPLAHVKKHEIVKGDASVQVENYLKRNPETIIALAYFDFDIYEPTKKCLEAIKDRLVKGSIIGFDELNDPSCLGETLALMEVIGLPNVRLKKVPWCTKPCWYVIE